MKHLIKVHNLSKSYLQKDQTHQKVLDKVNLTISQGALVAIVGKNGSGKTTLINCISGLLEFDEGEIEINVDNLHYKLKRKLDSRIDQHFRRKVGIVSQKMSLWPHYNILNNVKRPLLDILKLDDEHSNQRAYEWLDQLFNDLQPEKRRELYKKFPDQLSGGEYRRVAIARTLAFSPDILIVDELEANLDPWIVEDVLRIIEFNYITNPHKTVLMVTHRTDFIIRMASSLIVINNGQAKKYPSLDAIIQQGDFDMIEWLDTKRNPIYVSNQALFTSKVITEYTLTYKGNNGFYQIITNEISKLIAKIDHDWPHLITLVTKDETDNNLLLNGIKIWKDFILDGKQSDKFGTLLEEVKKDKSKNQIVYQLKNDNEIDKLINGGFIFDQNPSGSLIASMFDKNKIDRFNYNYPPYNSIPGVHNETINSHLRSPMYAEFSKATKNVYLFPMQNEEGNIIGVISIDTYAKSRWLPFVVSHLKLMSNLGAIAIRLNGLQTS